MMSFSSCKKTSNLSLPTDPDPSFNINYLPGLTTSSITQTEDSLSSMNSSSFLLGTLYDSEFGITRAGFCTQLSISQSAIDFGKNATLDSCVLSLEYNSENNYYGVTDKLRGMQYFEVYESLVDLNKSNYYSNESMTSYFKSENALYKGYVYPKPSTPLYINGAKENPQLRFKLNESVGTKLLEASVSGNGNLSNNASFINYFKGLYIKSNNPFSSSGEGALLSFNALSTRLILYFKDSAGTAKNFEFKVFNTTPRFSVVEHDYTNAMFAAQLTKSESDPQKVYVSGAVGVKTKILLPFLDAFKDSGKTTINKCEIIIPVSGSTVNTTYPLPQRLYLAGIDADGKNSFTIDQLDNPAYGGGLSNGAYVFNVTRHAQHVVSGLIENRGLYLISPSAITTPNRVILLGKENILINLTYTKL